MDKVKQLFNLGNRNIIVAGGAGQIGFAFVEILIDAGATVIIADIDIEMAQKKCKESAIVSENTDSVFIKKLDVSNSKLIDAFYEVLSKEFGKSCVIY